MDTLSTAIQFINGETGGGGGTVTPQTGDMLLAIIAILACALVLVGTAYILSRRARLNAEATSGANTGANKSVLA